MLDGKDSSVEQMENVKIYVNAEHGRRIKRLEPCDSSEKIEKIRNFGAQRKTRVSVPPNRVSEYRMLDTGIHRRGQRGRGDAEPNGKDANGAS